MREIKFRGKRLDNGEWIKGNSIVRLGDGVFICGWTGVTIKKSEFYNLFTEVDPATVGQYTGLKDKNDKKIYEGDILQDEIGFKGKIIYSMGAFCGDFGEGFELQYFSEGLHEACILAGNIHDNPELLNNFADSK